MDLSVWREHGDPLAPATGTGPLDGVRVAVKDLFALAGHRTGAGNPHWLADSSAAAKDATALARLRRAGAEVAGLAQTDELAFSLSGANVHYGTPPNPAAPDLVTGGSSNGPASAVATGEADAGLGTDTGGSVRVPASCCGLYGLRPTHGVVPVDGVVPLAPSFDTVGWLTRDPALLRAVGRVLLPAYPSMAPRRLLVPAAVLDDLPPAVAEAVRAAAGDLAAAWDVQVDLGRASWARVEPPLLAAFRAVQAAEAWRLHGAWIDAHPGALGAGIEGRFRFGATVSAADERHARRLIGEWKRTVELWDGVWLALPAAGGPAHPRAATPAATDAWRMATLRCTVLASACGLPSAVLPTRGGPPLGLALVAPAGADHSLLDALCKQSGESSCG
jgi:amidase